MKHDPGQQFPKRPGPGFFVKSAPGFRNRAGKNRPKYQNCDKCGRPFPWQAIKKHEAGCTAAPGY